MSRDQVTRLIISMKPGTIVSSKAEELETLDAGTTTCKRMGVVQATDALERIAKVRWFSDPEATVCELRCVLSWYIVSAA